MRYLSIVLLILLSISELKSQENSFRYPAEWEPHQAIWVNHRGYDRDTVVDKMIMAIHKKVPVICRTPSDSLIDILITRYEGKGADLSKIGFLTIHGIKRVVRDRGPIFVKDSNDKLTIVDFNFAWSYPYKYDVYDGEKNYSRNIGELFNIPVVNSELIHEGGAIEINQQGTLLQVTPLVKHHNPQFEKKEVEKRLKNLLGIKQFIWLEEGLASDPQNMRIVDNKFALGVGGHVDEFARFVNDTTIFLAMPDDSEKNIDAVMSITYARMLKNYEILKSAKRLDGKPFNIVKIPVPYYPPRVHVIDDSEKTPYPFDLIREQYGEYKTGDTLYLYATVSYLNFLVTNGQVLIPKYGDDQLKSIEHDVIKQQELKARLTIIDEFTRRLFKQYFPGRAIVQINPIGLNWYGGGIHCWSQQMPVGSFN